MTTLDAEAPILHRVSAIVSSKLSLDEMLGEVIGLTIRVTACDACLVYLLDPATKELVLRASQVPHATALGNLRMSIGEGVTGWVAQHQAPVALSRKAASDDRFQSFPGLVEDTYQAFLSVPLVSAGDVVGVVNVHHRDEHAHTAEEISTLVFIGQQLGGVVVRSLLEAERAKLLEETVEVRRELEARKVIERAKGILQKRMGMTEEAAYLSLRNRSRELQRPMKELAEALILSEELQRSSEMPISPVDRPTKRVTR